MRISRGARLLLPVLGLAVLATLLLATWNVGRFKPRIERAFAAATGRTLTIDGPVELHLLPTPELLARNVSVANLPGGSKATMITARTLGASIDPLGLLAHRLELSSVTVDGADVLLETVGGVPNWRFHPQRAPGSSSPASHPPARPLSFRLDEVEATSLQLRWDAPGRLGRGELSVDKLRARTAGNTTSLFVAARHGDVRLHLSAATSLEAGLGAAPSSRSARPLRARLTLDGNGATGLATFEGTVTPSSTSYDGRLTATISRLASLDRLFPHAALPPAANLDLRAEISGQGQGVRIGRVEASGRNVDLNRWARGVLLASFAVRAVSADAPLVLNASGSIRDVPGTIAGTAGSLALIENGRGQAPVDLGVSLGRDTLKLQGSVIRTGPRGGALQAQVAYEAPDPAPIRSLFGPDAVRLSSTEGQLGAEFHEGSLAATLDTKTLQVGNSAWPPSHVAVTLDPRRNLHVTAALAGQSPWLSLNDVHGTGAIDLALHGQQLPAFLVTSLLSGDGLDGTLSLTVNLQGRTTGDRLDPRSLSGPIDATLKNAELPPSLIRRLVDPLLADARLPSVSGTTVRVGCASGGGALADGRMTINHFTVVSPVMDATGSGTVDLATSTIALALAPTLRFGPTSISTTASVTGSLTHPVVSLAPGSGGRFGLRIGGNPPPMTGACAGSARPKLPNAASLLRGLGLFR